MSAVEQLAKLLEESGAIPMIPADAYRDEFLALTAERDALKVENERLKGILREVIVEAGGLAAPGVSVDFLAHAPAEVRGVMSKHRAALRETREALADTLGLATKVAICEMEAMVSKEPGSDVFGCAGIAEKAKVARARAAWKAFDDCVKPVLAKYAALVEGGERG